MDKKDIQQLKNKINKVTKEHQQIKSYLDNDEQFFFNVLQNSEKLTKEIDERLKNIQLISAQLEEFIISEEWKSVLITSQFDPFSSYAKIQQIINDLQTLKQRIAEYITSTYKKIADIRIKKATLEDEDEYSQKARELDQNYFQIEEKQKD